MIKYQPAKNRTLEENKYYHGVIVKMVSTHICKNSEITHDFLKEVFGIESTAELITTEFEEMCENIRNHAKKYWKIIIPLPNE